MAPGLLGEKWAAYDGSVMKPKTFSYWAGFYQPEAMASMDFIKFLPMT
jgi:hypothetical protein